MKLQMNRWKWPLAISMIISSIAGCTPQQKRTDGGCHNLQAQIADVISGKAAHIGVAVIYDDKDTTAVRGSEEFPMMSVMKFPQALAVASWMDANSLSMNDSITIGAGSLNKDTYSPMLRKYGEQELRISWKELLGWSLMESDNNACDVLFSHIGGPAGTMELLRRIKMPDDITIEATEDDMYRDNSLSYRNWSTPLAMAGLFNRFDTELRQQSASLAGIAEMLEQCRTGQDRLAAPLPDDVVIGHKTGTGFMLPDGRIMAVNDCGYVHLPDGHRYAIAVFVADAACDMESASKIIADISGIVYHFYSHRP